MNSGSSLPGRSTEADAFFFASPQQEEVYRMLDQLVGLGPAAAYRDACQLRSDNRYPTRAHLIGHLQREIDGCILDVIAPPEMRSADVDDSRRKQLAELCRVAELSPKGDSRRNKINAICRILELSPESEPIRRWLKMRLDAVAHRKNLSIRDFSPAFQIECDHYDSILHAVLKAFASSFQITIDRVNSLLQKPNPTKRDVTSLRVSVPNHRTIFDQVFDKQLSRPWIETLLRERFFEDPPEQAVVPALKYATTYATEDLPTALVIATDLPQLRGMDATRQFVLLLLALPGPDAGRLLPKLVTWFESLKRPLNTTEQAVLSTSLGRLLAHASGNDCWGSIVRITEYVSGFSAGAETRLTPLGNNDA